MEKSTSSKGISLKENEMLILRGSAGIVAIVKAGPDGQFFLETEKEEKKKPYCRFCAFGGREN